MTHANDRDEQALLEAARGGDPRAFEHLVRPYLPTVRRFAYAFARDWADADDLAQDCLIKAFRSLKGFRGQSNLATWLYSIARSTFIDSRRGKKAKLLSLARDEVEEEVDPQMGADVLLGARADVEALWRAIQALEARFRVPLVLFEIEGMSYEHIAAIERIPVGTVRSRLNRARAKLAESLGAPEEGAPEPLVPGTPWRARASNVSRRQNT